MLAEKSLLGLFGLAIDRRPDQAKPRLQRLIEDDQFLFALLTAALSTVVSEPLQGGAVRHSERLDWQALTRMVPEDLLRTRVQAIDVDLARQNQDDRALAALLAAEELAAE